MTLLCCPVADKIPELSANGVPGGEISTHTQRAAASTAPRRADLSLLNLEGRLVTDREIHGAGNEAESMDVLVKLGRQFQVRAFLH